MSKTIKTQPLWVKMLRYRKEGHKHIGLEDVHEHTNGRECDLPATVEEQFTEENEKHYHSPNHCYWDWTYIGVQTCGCKICTDQRSRKRNTRAARHSETDNMQTLARQLRDVDLHDEEEILDAVDASEKFVSPGKW